MRSLTAFALFFYSIPTFLLGLLLLYFLYLQLPRASMLDVLGEDYIRTARSKGVDIMCAVLDPRVRLH